MAINQSDIDTAIDAVHAAITAAAAGQSYTLSFPDGSSRTVSRQDLPSLQTLLADYHRQLIDFKTAAAGGAAGFAVAGFS